MKNIFISILLIIITPQLNGQNIEKVKIVNQTSVNDSINKYFIKEIKIKKTINLSSM